MCHRIEWCRGSKSCLILVGGVPARSNQPAILLREGRCCPTVIVEFGREDVVETDASGELLHAQLLQTERIAEVDIGGKVSVEHHADIDGSAIVVECLIALEACVRQILIAHILALDAGLHSFILEVEDIVEDEVRRERQRGITQTLHRAVHQRHLPVLRTILREGGVSIPAEPVDRFPSCLQLHTQTIALTHILGDGFADRVQLARQHKLITIAHPVEIGASTELLALELIAGLQIVQPLSLQLCSDIILVVVTCGLLMGDGIRSIDFMMRRDVVVQAKLRIEEVEVVVDDIFACRVSCQSPGSCIR